MTRFDAPNHRRPGTRLRLSIATLALLTLPQLAAGDDLFAAAKRGDLFGVRHYLKKAPGSVEAGDASGYTALHWAGIRGRWEVFAELIAAGAPVGAVGRDGGTPLHWACHHDRPDMVRLLLDAGADLAVANQWGRTPLHVATRRGCDLVASLLLARGADPNAPTREGWTPLHVAYMAGQPRLVRLLLDAGAAADRVSDAGRTPAECAFERPKAVALEASELEAYVGRYALGPEATVNVWQERGRLRLVEFAPDELYPIGSDLFFCRQEPWQVRFVRGADGHVDAIELRFLRRTVTGKRLPEYEYVGSARCAECHLDRESGAQYLHWLQSRHGLAYWRLATGLAKFLASRREQYQDIVEPIREWRCLKCHVAGAQDEQARLAESFAQEEGVGCEACHGPGSAYVTLEIMQDRELFLLNGGRLPTEQTCRQCHQDERFRYAERLVKIAHPRPNRVEDPHQ